MNPTTLELTELETEILFQLAMDHNAKLTSSEDIGAVNKLVELGYAKAQKTNPDWYSIRDAGRKAFMITKYGDKGTGAIILKDFIRKRPKMRNHFFLNIKPEYLNLIVYLTKELYKHAEAYKEGDSVEEAIKGRDAIVGKFYASSDKIGKLTPLNYPHFLFMNIDNLYKITTVKSPDSSGLVADGYVNSLVQHIAYCEHDWLECKDLLDEICASWAVISVSDGNDVAFSLCNGDHFKTTQGYEHVASVLHMIPNTTGDYHTNNMYGRIVTRRIDPFIEYSKAILESEMVCGRTHSFHLGAVNLHKEHFVF